MGGGFGINRDKKMGVDKKRLTSVHKLSGYTHTKT